MLNWRYFLRLYSSVRVATILYSFDVFASFSRYVFRGCVIGQSQSIWRKATTLLGKTFFRVKLWKALWLVIYRGWRDLVVSRFTWSPYEAIIFFLSPFHWPEPIFHSPPWFPLCPPWEPVDLPKNPPPHPLPLPLPWWVSACPLVNWK